MASCDTLFTRTLPQSRVLSKLKKIVGEVNILCPQTGMFGKKSNKSNFQSRITLMLC